MNQIISGGQAYSTSHLVPIAYKISLCLRGGFKKMALVEFHFSHHCFTSSLPPGKPKAHDCYRFDDGSPHKPRLRIFDLERYTLSLDLPRHIDNLVSLDLIVSKTGRRDNIVRVDKMPVTRNGIAELVSYYILMHPTKIPKAVNTPAKLKVVVESAYPEKAGFHGPKMKNARELSKMLGEYW